MLAKAQVREVQNFFPGMNFLHIPIETKGDKDKLTSISETGESGFFTAEIEKALINNEIDFAVHSAKDLEDRVPDGLRIAALTRSISPYECLVSSSGLTLEKLADGAIVGTSSKKRKDALKKFRVSLVAKDIRGDIEDRLRQLDEGSFDAIIVAHAALIRLGLLNRITEIISEKVIPAHPLQGSLALQVREDDEYLIKLFSSIDILEEKK